MALECLVGEFCFSFFAGSLHFVHAAVVSELAIADGYAKLLLNGIIESSRNPGGFLFDDFAAESVSLQDAIHNGSTTAITTKVRARAMTLNPILVSCIIA